MELQIAGTNTELTPEMKSYAERKLGKLDKHLAGIIETRVEISEEKTKSRQQRFLVRVTVNSGIGGMAGPGRSYRKIWMDVLFFLGSRGNQGAVGRRNGGATRRPSRPR